MKTKYESAELEIIDFVMADIICSSLCPTDGDIFPPAIPDD